MRMGLLLKEGVVTQRLQHFGLQLFVCFGKLGKSGNKYQLDKQGKPGKKWEQVATPWVWKVWVVPRAI